MEYHDGDCPVAEEIVDTCVQLIVNEFHTKEDLNDTITAINKVCNYFRNAKQSLAGKHIVLEKPMTFTLDKARKTKKTTVLLPRFLINKLC